MTRRLRRTQGRVALTVRLPADLAGWLTAEAEGRGVSASALGVELLTEARRRAEDPDRLARVEAELARIVGGPTVY